MADLSDRARIEAGPVTFVVEYRSVVQNGVDASGPTIRVVGTDDEHEYLRFDMFNVNAHYHYEPPDDPERVIALDTVAEGEPVGWAIDRLRDRLGPMLTEAGGQRLLDTLDPDTLMLAISEVEKQVHEAQAAAARDSPVTGR